MSLCNIFVMQAILYQFKRDVAAWKRVGCPQRMQRTWWQIVETPYTGFRLLLMRVIILYKLCELTRPQASYPEVSLKAWPVISCSHNFPKCYEHVICEALIPHYDDVIMGAMASQITSLTTVYSTVYSDADKKKHQSSASLAFVRGIHRGPVNSPHKWPVTRKMFPFHDVITGDFGTTSAWFALAQTSCASCIICSSEQWTERALINE